MQSLCRGLVKVRAVRNVDSFTGDLFGHLFTLPLGLDLWVFYVPIQMRGVDPGAV
jgi:hypothetical protein